MEENYMNGNPVSDSIDALRNEIADSNRKIKCLIVLVVLLIVLCGYLCYVVFRSTNSTGVIDSNHRVLIVSLENGLSDSYRSDKTQMKNAFFLLLLSQGTPCILAGDEFGNSQKGNNNVYCQDNAVSWLNWSQLSKEKELHDFVKVLIALRKEYPLLYPEKEMTGADRTGRGVPDVSYHGEEAWRAPFERTSRQLGVYYSAATREEEECFIAYNMHWTKHDFALPILSKGKNWYLRASTQDGVLTEPSLLKEQKKVELPPRTVMFITGR